MNEKKNTLFILIVFVSLFFVTGCQSTRVLDNGISTTDIRDGVHELEKSELEARETNHELESTVRESAESHRRIESILQQIREQSIDRAPGEGRTKGETAQD